MYRLVRRTLFTGSAALAGVVLWGAQSASADGGTDTGADQAQEAVVDNSTTQSASAVVSSGQWNVSSPVSVGGGGGGNVTQSNTATNSATSSNSNDTIQEVDQAQGSSGQALGGSADAGGQDQVADAYNETDQSADAEVSNGQWNVASGTSVGGGGGGSVDQSNMADNEADASNDNITDQIVTQEQGASSVAVDGDASGGGQSQDAIVDNWTSQDASAAVDNGQWNVSAPVSVGGGMGGDTTQSNDATNSASASNSNDTIQEVGQAQGSSSQALGGSAGSSGQDQIADAINTTDQSANAAVDNGQWNVASGTSVGGGGGGSVDQSNTADNSADASNDNITDQIVTQEQGAGSVAVFGDASSGGQSQDAIVDNWTSQDASAAVDNGQWNVSAPVSVGGGMGGDTTQSNDATNSASASNSNDTIQDVLQLQGSSSVALFGSASTGAQDQIADAINTTDQDADATIYNGQWNVASGTSVGGGGGGSVDQSNTADNSADASNDNITDQIVTQEQGAGSVAVFGDASSGGQSQDSIVDNWTSQDASAAVDNGQWNVSAPVSVGSGGGGDTTQSNDATNSAMASNSNDTIQDVLQLQGSSSVALGGSAYAGAQDQVADAYNKTDQSADAKVDNGQWNVAAGTSVGGGGGGSVDQSNMADNSADASNDNITDQIVTQAQGQGGSGSGSGQDQSATLDNDTDQSADADVTSGQWNTSAPVSVGGEGGGDTTQSNDATSSATADNSNDTIQEVDQGQAAGGAGGSAAAANAGGGDNGNGNGNGGQDQSADVANETDQSAYATVDNGQWNVAAGASVGGGGGGSVDQSNTADNEATATNTNMTDQFVEQAQAGSGTGAGQGQDAAIGNSTGQSAYASIWNGQWNIFAPVSVGSPGAFSGSVTQSNTATNLAMARNANTTRQGVAQGQGANGGYGSGQGQYAGLFNSTGQSASAGVYNIQANIYAPVWIGSPGAGSGDVTQTNTATNGAMAANTNSTDQAALQGQAGTGSGAGQGQDATVGNATGQSAGAAVYNAQWNIYAPVAVGSPGAGSGSVTQSNSAMNTAMAGNTNDTTQAAGQGQAAGGSMTGSGQGQYGMLFNTTAQGANGAVYNIQANIYAPVFVGSAGAGSGAVSQSNTAMNSSSAMNTNSTFQSLLQGLGISLFRF